MKLNGTETKHLNDITMRRDEYENSFYYVAAEYIDDELIGIIIRPKNLDNYLPEIFYYDGIVGNEKIRFAIQTTSFGAMNVPDMRKVVSGYTRAIDTVEELEEIFCKDEDETCVSLGDKPVK